MDAAIAAEAIARVRETPRSRAARTARSSRAPRATIPTIPTSLAPAPTMPKLPTMESSEPFLDSHNPEPFSSHLSMTRSLLIKATTRKLSRLLETIPSPNLSRLETIPIAQSHSRLVGEIMTTRNPSPLVDAMKSQERSRRVEATPTSVRRSLRATLLGR